MSIFTSAKAKLAAQKLAEEQLYELAAEEIAANNIRPGLWAKAIAESDGDDAKAKARYIKLRVETMKAETDLADFMASETSSKRHSSVSDAPESTNSENFGFIVLALGLVITVGGLLFAAIGLG